MASADVMQHPLLSVTDISVSVPDFSEKRSAFPRKALVGIVAAAVVVTVVLAVTLPLALRPRPRITASAVIADALQAGASATGTSTNQVVVIAENLANQVLASLSKSFAGQSITISGVTIQEVTGTNAGAELASIDPVLANLPVRGFWLAAFFAYGFFVCRFHLLPLRLFTLYPVLAARFSVSATFNAH